MPTDSFELSTLELIARCSIRLSYAASSYVDFTSEQKLVTSLVFFLDIFRNVFFKKKTSKIPYEETPAFLRFFQKIFLQKLNISKLSCLKE